MTGAGNRRAVLARGLLFVAPALFASNMLTARAVEDIVPPAALAFWRWTATAAILLPFVAPALWRRRAAIRAEWRDLLLLGTLGMAVCGGFVYVAAHTTTAMNIGLIYTASPVLIILLARFAFGEHMGLRQVSGAAMALLGVLVVVTKADPDVLLGLRFTAGDLWVSGATVSWAVYTVLLRHRPTTLPPNLQFFCLCAAGALVLAPFHLWESIAVGPPDFGWRTAGIVLFLALVTSLAAYQTYAFIQRHLGAGRTGLLMYLVPLYAAGAAMVLLEERLEAYHLAGAALMLPGLWLATRR